MAPDLVLPEWPIPREGEFYLLFHSPRCVYRMAHPVSVMESRDKLYSSLIKCREEDCFVTVGRVKSRRGAARVENREVREAYRKATGNYPEYISRAERAGIKVPKTRAQLATWMRQTRKGDGK